MAALLGLKAPDDADKKTVEELAKLSTEEVVDDEPEDPAPRVDEPMDDLAADRALFARRRSEADGLAFDRASVRTIDQDGRLHVEMANISKANVCGYLGSEIPGAEELGLDPRRIYQLLRDPKELEAAASTFNNIPVLSQHVPVSVDDHKPGLVVGSTGTDAEFRAPYLRNSLVFWTADAIEGIESGEQRELSCAYRYVADMTPGTYQGTPYDGVMRQLRGNHVALVATGRAGPDVVVGDSQLASKEPEMQSKPLSRRATLAKGALLGLVKPAIAADSAILDRILAPVTAKNWHVKKPLLLAAVKPYLAQDVDMSHVAQLMDHLDKDQAPPAGAPPLANDNPDDMMVDDADPCAEILGMLRGKLSDEDMAAVSAKLQAMSGPPAMDTPAPVDTTNLPPEGKPVSGQTNKPPVDATPGGAMDSAAVKQAIDAAVANTRRLAREAAEARQVVQPYVGEVDVALDSGEAVFKAALELMGVNTDGVHPSAYRPILEAQPKPGQSQRRLGQDSKPANDFAERFPHLSNIRTM